MKKLVIDREQWIRGEGPQFSALLRKTDDMMCCVGFYCRQVLELSKEEIKNKRVLNEIENKKAQQAARKNFDVVTELYRVNDNNMAEGVREQALIELFKAMNVEVSFIN